MKKRSFTVIMLLLMTYLLAACGGNGETINQSTTPVGENGESGASAVEVYKIGAIYSKTGPNSPLGDAEWNTTLLLEQKINKEGGINGVPIKILLADDESEQEKAMQEMNRLIHDEQVLAILGSTGSGPSLAMKGIAMQTKTPMISAAASSQIVEPVDESYWIFKTPQSDALAVQRIYMYLNEQGIDQIGVLTDTNAYGASGLEHLEALASEYQIQIVAKEAFNMQDPDMRTQLTNIQNKGAQAVVVWGSNPAPAIISKNMKELGMTIPHISSHGIANQAFIDLAGEAAEGVVIPAGKLLFPDQIADDDPQYAVISNFYNEYKAIYNSEPTQFGAYGYDNLMLVVEALKAGATDRESIRDYLENNIRDYVGATGIFNFTKDDHNGLTADSFVMATVKDGKWTLLSY